MGRKGGLGVVICPECKGLMRPTRGKFACPKCGEVKRGESLVVRGTEKRRIDKLDDLGIIEDPAKFDMQIWPTDHEVRCGRCGNWGAYYYLKQTRRADEPTTAFYRCTKCRNQWKRAR